MTDMPEEIWALPFAKDTPIARELDGGYCGHREGYLPEQKPTSYTRTILALILMTSTAQAGCGMNRDETGNTDFEMKICATNLAACDPEDDPNGNCESVPVFELTEEDMEEPEPFTFADVAAWRDIEPSGGE